MFPSKGDPFRSVNAFFPSKGDPFRSINAFFPSKGDPLRSINAFFPSKGDPWRSFGCDGIETELAPPSPQNLIHPPQFQASSAQKVTRQSTFRSLRYFW
jgi:hypothetical protein